ncbi:MAG: response regulator [Bacteroidetes bacterium]|nr:response regulator [Bacteroidota bacterium]MBU1579299.1 response regulator [Bacteroidota bacterium]MBU2466523.1 response regulator [Bacteroidota bacterium]
MTTYYKILIVDDVIDNLKAMSAIIEANHPGYKIFQANSGESALNALKYVTPDIILSDWEMPDMTGIELIRQIKTDAATCHIPAIIVSGVMIRPQDLKTAIEAGAVDYIRKPINAVEMLSRMHAALTITEKHQQLIKEKESKILENILFANDVNAFLKKTIKKTDKLLDELDPESTLFSTAQEIKQGIHQKMQTSGWRKYTKAYNKLHPEFTKRLLRKHPDLTPGEIELCEMTRLGLSTKEVSDLLFITPQSLFVGRSRLRKKLNITSVQNLQTYLSSI